MQPWAAQTFEPEHGGIGPKTDGQVFERRLRLNGIARGDPDRAALQISASFRSDNIEGFARVLEAGFDVRAERRRAHLSYCKAAQTHGRDARATWHGRPAHVSRQAVSQKLRCAQRRGANEIVPVKSW